MVVGLEKFAEHFADFKDRYVLIGGAATWLVLDEAGIDPRATKDLDIVLCLESLDPEFGAVFWDFVKSGGYAVQEKSAGDKNFYRFQNPSQQDYPAMLELFSRKPDQLVLVEDAHLTPIPVGEDVASLSAILLEEGYCEFLHQRRIDIDGISMVGEDCLIPLKARAWLDLTHRKGQGGKVDSRDIKKHRNDVLRLYQLLAPDLKIELSSSMQGDLVHFLRAVEPEIDVKLLKQLGIQGVTVANVFHVIRVVYGISEK